MKALFMDYYGTVAHETGPIAIEVIQQIYKTGNANSPEEIMEYWWRTFREQLVTANGENFRTQHDVAFDNFHDLLEHFSSGESPEKLLQRMEEHWATTPLYDDVEPFMRTVPYPVYFVTNSDDSYIFANMAKHGLRPAGVITSEQAKYSKPRKEIFLYALNQLGLKSSEVIHIGDSLTSDVKCPNSVGIKAIWLNREKKPVPDGIASADSLSDVFKYL